MNRALFSLAIIRTNWEHNQKDYIENFTPLFASLIKQHNYTEISLENLETIQKDFKKDYGLNIPQNPIITILKRLSKKKIIIKKNNKFIPNPKEINKIDIAKISSQIIREFEHITNAIIKFIKRKHDIITTPKEIEEALICYLKKHDLELLFAAEKNSLLPKVKPNEKSQYLINEFIGNAFSAEPQLFKFIVNLSIGHALSSTILFNDFNKYTSNFKNLSLFLDTPFIFNLLGINGKHKKSLAQELISILHKEGAKVFILEITKKEVLSNLEEALNLFNNGKKDPINQPLTFKACIENGFNSNDIEQIFIGLLDILLKMNIGYNHIPNYNEYREYQIDEKKLYQTILDAYGITKYQSSGEPNNEIFFNKDDKINNTIYRDVQVLSGIYRYRLGNFPTTLKDCKYLFITTNSSLAYASRKFEKCEYGQKYSLPTCLTDTFLGTLIWLHSPTQIETFSEKKIIADCYAALKPDEKIIGKYLEDVEKLKNSGEISNEHYILLRTHRAAINILEDKTLGDINEFKANTTEEILKELLDEIKSEERKKYQNELKQHSITQKELDTEKKEHHDTKELLNKNKQDEIQKQLEKNEKIGKSSNKKATRSIFIIQFALFFFLITSIVIIILKDLISIKINNYLYLSGWLIFTLTSCLNIITGFNILQIKKKLIKKLTNYYKKRIETEIEKYN